MSAPVELTVSEAEAALDDSALLLDVRGADEVARGVDPRAVTIPLDQLPERYTELDPAREIVVICAHGMRSLRAASFLNEAGYRASSVAGGMTCWPHVR